MDTNYATPKLMSRFGSTGYTGRYWYNLKANTRHWQAVLLIIKNGLRGKIRRAEEGERGGGRWRKSTDKKINATTGVQARTSAVANFSEVILID